MIPNQTSRPSADRAVPWLSLANLKLRHKLAAVMVLVLVAIGALSALRYVDMRSSALEDRALMTKRLTEVAQSLLGHYEAQATAGSKGEAEKAAAKTFMEKYG